MSINLPPLPSLTPSPSSSSSNTTAATGSGSSSSSSFAGSVASGIASGLLGGIPIQRVVVILIGLLLIAAGIFAFRPVRETVVTAAKTGAKAAAAA